MKMKRFLAPDMGEAIRLIRETLGEDAVIITNKKVKGGVEIIASSEPMPTSETANSDLATPVAAAPRPAAARAPQTAPAQAQWLQDPCLDSMQAEIHQLRGLLEEQLAGLAWANQTRQNPTETMLFQRLLQLGFDTSVAKQMAKLGSAGERAGDQAWRHTLNILAQKLTVTENDILQNGGVVALVGPTGVGKTTTIAKLAARYALQNSADSVALITTDAYRIAAHEQLKIYGKVLGIPVRIVNDEASLRSTLRLFRDKRLVLIDTAGMGQRDVRLQEQFALLSGPNFPIKHYVVLSATHQRMVSDEAARMFAKIGLKGAIITKLDECGSLGGLLSVLMKHQLSAAYITDGQRVPEDIHVARSHNLISSAITIASQQQIETGDQAAAYAYSGKAEAFD